MIRIWKRSSVLNGGQENCSDCRRVGSRIFSYSGTYWIELNWIELNDTCRCSQYSRLIHQVQVLRKIPVSRWRINGDQIYMLRNNIIQLFYQKYREIVSVEWFSAVLVFMQSIIQVDWYRIFHDKNEGVR